MDELAAEVWQHRAETARRLAYSLHGADCSKLLRYAEECEKIAAYSLAAEGRDNRH